MNRALSICFAIVAAALLMTGYTWNGRYEKSLALKRTVREEVKKFDSEMKAKYPAAHEHDPTNEQLAPFEALEDSSEKQTALLAGVIQSCVGWIVFGLAAVVWCLPVAKKVANTSC